MDIQKIKLIVKEILPKIELKYGYSKFAETTPYVEYEKSIYARLAGEDDDGALGEECPDAEYDRIDNSIVIYYPQMTSRKQIIETLIHEYQHYLQSPSWFTRYYNMGFEYNNHPYEIAATKEELNWNKL
tara:strand:+ start:938 stop:1324 length:387 start_codon:yes stop_codon:yes gene_type:complete